MVWARCIECAAASKACNTQSCMQKVVTIRCYESTSRHQGIHAYFSFLRSCSRRSRLFKVQTEGAADTLGRPALTQKRQAPATQKSCEGLATSINPKRSWVRNVREIVGRIQVLATEHYPWERSPQNTQQLLSTEAAISLLPEPVQSISSAYRSGNSRQHSNRSPTGVIPESTNHQRVR